MRFPGFSSGPSPTPPPEPPTREDPAIEEQRRLERLAALRRRGRIRTILTSEQGDPSRANTARKTLGGA